MRDGPLARRLGGGHKILSIEKVASTMRDGTQGLETWKENEKGS
jgi:hypothetical protein